VLLCAEEDDLELVALVHLGRQRGLALEVRPGVEVGDGPLLCALDDTPRALLVLIRSDNLPAQRALALKSTFALARTDEQDLLAVRFDPARVEAALEVIARKLEQLGPDPALVDVVCADAATNRLTPVGMPIIVEADDDIEIDIDESSSAPVVDVTEYDVTIRQSIEHTGPSWVEAPAYEEAIAIGRPRSRKRVLVGVLAFGGLAAAATFGAMAMGDESAPRVEVAPATPVEVIEAPVPDPAPAEAWKPTGGPAEVAPTPLAEPIEGDPQAAGEKKQHKHKQPRRHRRRRH
jgi:hypothetical protein